MSIDGTRKWKEEGYGREWPEVARMRPEVTARVDAMWGELGIGGPATKANGASHAKEANGHGRRDAVSRLVKAAREIVRGHS